MMNVKLAVIGDPVAHSRSPALFHGFFAEAGIAGTYEAIRVPAGDAARAIGDLHARGYTALNVTTPLKEEAFTAVASVDEIAQAADALNTIVLGEKVRGYNTDGRGVLGALEAAGLGAVRGAAVLVLGAGPTARAALVALRAAHANASLWNRTRAKADAVARRLGVHCWAPGDRVDAVVSTLPPDARFEALSSDGRTDDTSQLLYTAVQTAPIVIDANYGARATFGRYLERTDVHDGDAMLRASARASFELFIAVHRD